MKIYHLIHGQKSKNIQTIKNLNRWFGLDYEIVYFLMFTGEVKLKKMKWPL